MNDERRKALTEYRGLCWHEFKLPNKWNDGNICIHCGKRIGDVYATKPTYTTDADMMALFRRIYYNAHWDIFVWWLKDNLYYDTAIPEIFLEPEKFCFLVSEWRGAKK